MSCSAKLPVYIILAGAFFGPRAGTVIFAIYLLGVILSIITGRVFRTTLLRGADAPFVMELPPYRVPMLKSLFIHMWDRSKIFLKKMGKVILVGSVIIWALSAFPRNISYSIDYDSKIDQIIASSTARLETAADSAKPEIEKEKEAALASLEKARQAEHAEKSFIGRIGKISAPIFAPLGIDWRGGVALLTGFVAKEIVVSTLGVLHAVGDSESSEELKNALQTAGMTPLSALSMMIFVLLYLPCLATIAAIKRETGSYKWMFFSILYSTSVAWIMSFIVYQVGKIMGYA
jgi:ferrous iron transport protein B